MSKDDVIGEEVLALNSVFREFYNVKDEAGTTSAGELMKWVSRALTQMIDGSANEWSAGQAIMQLSLIAKFTAQVAGNVAEIPGSMLMVNWARELFGAEVGSGSVVVIEADDELAAVLGALEMQMGISNPLTGEPVERDDD